MRKYLNLRANIALGLIFAFFFNSLGPIQTANAEPIYSVEGEFHLPAPGILVQLSPAFNPPILKGLKVHPDNPFRFDFILDQGDMKPFQHPVLEWEAKRLIKYFLASLTIPEKDLWVNLSPYEKNRIIPKSFGLTEMGRDLLAEDYMLKQIMASLIYPEGEVGRKFWQRIYAEAAKRFGTTNIPVNTFNKIWIVPDKALVYENDKAGTAYVVEAKLKVMLEEDYLSLSHHSQTKTHSLASQVVREVVIPELNKEVNDGANFAQLRQVYNSLILATWYKRKIKDSIINQVYGDKNKTAGVDYKNSINVALIYQRYLQAFKKGVYNYIKEEYDPSTQETLPKKYFSGGASLYEVDNVYEGSPQASLIPKLSRAMIIGMKINPMLMVPANPSMMTERQKNIQDAVHLLSSFIVQGQNPKNEDDLTAKRHAEELLLLWGLKHGFQGTYAHLDPRMNFAGFSFHTDIDDLFASIPAGSSWQGGGLSALVLKHGEIVTRIAFGHVQRPRIDGLLQPLEVQYFGDYTVEKLPLVQRISSHELAEAIQTLNSRLKAQGYRLRTQEINVSNVGIWQGQYVVIDPGAIKRDDAMKALGRVVILIGSSGSGKSTFRRKLIDEGGDKDLSYVRIVTNRERKKDEPYPDEFVFLSPQDFDTQEQAGKIIFVRENFGGMYKYGNYVSDIKGQLELGKKVIIETSSSAAVAKIKDRYPQAKVILISPFDEGKPEAANIADLKKRLEGRGVPEREIDRRTQDALDSERGVQQFHPIVIKNVYAEDYAKDKEWNNQYGLFKEAIAANSAQVSSKVKVSRAMLSHLKAAMDEFSFEDKYEGVRELNHAFDELIDDKHLNVNLNDIESERMERINGTETRNAEGDFTQGLILTSINDKPADVLIRDRLPEILRKQGKEFTTQPAQGNKKRELLIKKLEQEYGNLEKVVLQGEYPGRYKDLVHELAAVREVILAIEKENFDAAMAPTFVSSWSVARDMVETAPRINLYSIDSDSGIFRGVFGEEGFNDVIRSSLIRTNKQSYEGGWWGDLFRAFFWATGGARNHVPGILFEMPLSTLRAKYRGSRIPGAVEISDVSHAYLMMLDDRTEYKPIEDNVRMIEIRLPGMKTITEDEAQSAAKIQSGPRDRAMIPPGEKKDFEQEGTREAVQEVRETSEKENANAAMINGLAMEDKARDINDFIAGLEDHMDFYAGILQHEVLTTKLSDRGSRWYVIGNDGDLTHQSFYSKIRPVLRKPVQPNESLTLFSILLEYYLHAYGEIAGMHTFSLPGREVQMAGFRIIDNSHLQVPDIQQCRIMLQHFIEDLTVDLGFTYYDLRRPDAESIWQLAIHEPIVENFGHMSRWLETLGQALRLDDGRFQQFLLDDRSLTREAKETIVLQALVMAQQGETSERIIHEIFKLKDGLIDRYRRSEAIYGVLGTGGWESEVHRTIETSKGRKEFPSFASEAASYIYEVILGMVVDPRLEPDDYIEYVGRPALSSEIQNAKITALIKLGLIPMTDPKTRGLFNDLQYSGEFPEELIGPVKRDLDQKKEQELRRQRRPSSRRAEDIAPAPWESEYIDFAKLFLFVSKERMDYWRSNHHAIVVREAHGLNMPQVRFRPTLAETHSYRLQYPRGDISALPYSDFEQQNRMMRILHGGMIYYLYRKFRIPYPVAPQYQHEAEALADLFQDFLARTDNILRQFGISAQKLDLHLLSNNHGDTVIHLKLPMINRLLIIRDSDLETLMRKMVEDVLTQGETILTGFYAQDTGSGQEIQASNSAMINYVPKPEDHAQASLIDENSALSLFGKAYGLNFDVPASAQKEGFWEYEMPLGGPQRDLLDAHVIPAYIKGEKSQPATVRLVFYNEKPVLLTSQGLAWDQIDKEDQWIIQKSLGDKWALGFEAIERNGLHFGYAAYPLLTKEDDILFHQAIDWDIASHPHTSFDYYSKDLFKVAESPEGRKIVVFKGVYGPNTGISTDIFLPGIRPKKGALIYVMGAGTGIDAIVAADRAGENAKVVAIDIDPLAVANAKYNIQRLSLGERIEIHQGNLFNLRDALLSQKADHIYFNLPLDQGNGDTDFKTGDPKREIFKRLLTEAHQWLKEDGTLEINQLENPEVVSLILEHGWDIASIEGTNTVREKADHQNEWDYGRWILVRPSARAQKEQDWELLKSQWRELISIKEDFEQNRGSWDGTRPAQLWQRLSEIAASDFKQGSFHQQLLSKMAHQLLNMLMFSDAKQDVPDMRINEFYKDQIESSMAQLAVPQAKPGDRAMMGHEGLNTSEDLDEIKILSEYDVNPFIVSRSRKDTWYEKYKYYRKRHKGQGPWQGQWQPALRIARAKKDSRAAEIILKWSKKEYASLWGNLVYDPVTGKSGVIIGGGASGKTAISYFLSKSHFKILADDQVSIFLKRDGGLKALGNLSQNQRITTRRNLTFMTEVMRHYVSLDFLVFLRNSKEPMSPKDFIEKDPDGLVVMPALWDGYVDAIDRLPKLVFDNFNVDENTRDGQVYEESEKIKEWVTKAMVANTTTGGIDFTASRMNPAFGVSGPGIKFHMDPAMLAQLRDATGFVPVIISIKPLDDLKVFLGAAT